MRIGLDARSIFSPQPRGTGRNLFDAYRVIPGLRPEWMFHFYHQRPAADCVLANDLSDQGQSAWPANVTLRRIDIAGDRLDLWFQARLPIAAWRDGIDLLHLPANAAPVCCPTPMVVTVHDLVPLKVGNELPSRARAAFRRGILRALRRAVHIITPSAATHAELCGEYRLSHERVTVIPWAPDRVISGAGLLTHSRLQALRQRYGLDRPWLLNFSGASRRKNAVGLLTAFAQLPAEVREAHDLVLVGCSTAEFRASLAELAERLGIATHCRLLGFVPHSDLPALLGGARALLMPSLAEGFGLPILDAFASAVPVLTSNCSSMPEVAGDAAAYCDPTSTASIAKAIAHVVRPELARELVARGIRRLQQFSWARTAAAMCGVYERCLVETGRLGEHAQSSRMQRHTAQRRLRGASVPGARELAAGREVACR